MDLRRLSIALLALALAACKGKSSTEAAPARKIDASELPEPEPIEVDGQPLAAAGVEITVPHGWQILAEDEANFALAHDPKERPAYAPLCSIELRRQGVGELPPGSTVGPTQAVGDSELIDYSRGGLRGRFRELPGPTPAAKVVVHCRAPRSAKQWTQIEQAFASLRKLDEPAALPPVLEDPEIVELCTGSPARRTHVCARKRDGAVYCGASIAEELVRVADLPAAVELDCEGLRACIRDDEHQLWCWLPRGEPERVEAFAGGVVDLAGGCLVAADGRPYCPAAPEESGPTLAAPSFVELEPLGLALDDVLRVEALLPGSDARQGCVLVDGRPQCWDADERLPYARYADRVHPIPDLPAGEAIAEWAGRLCVGEDGRWTCAGEGEERWTVDGCERRACGCSLIAAARLSCEHEPHLRIDTRPLGRVAEVVATAGPCMGLRNGRVVCRGPAEQGGRRHAKTPERELAGGLPGVTHELRLVEQASTPREPPPETKAQKKPGPPRPLD